MLERLLRRAAARPRRSAAFPQRQQARLCSTWRWPSTRTSPRTSRRSARHQAAIRELSTPGHPRLRPRPAAAAGRRGRQPPRAPDHGERAHPRRRRAGPVVIIDIAGVPVVDTRVADHLLKTTAAVRLRRRRDHPHRHQRPGRAHHRAARASTSRRCTRVSRLGDGIELALGDGRQGHHRQGGLSVARQHPHPARRPRRCW